MQPDRSGRDGLGCRRPVAEAAVQTELAVFQPRALDERLRLEQRVEALAVEALVAQLAVERRDVAILSRGAGRDRQRLHAEADRRLAAAGSAPARIQRDG